MKKYRLTETNYKLLRSLPLFMETYEILFDDEQLIVSVSDINELMYDINDLIVMKGMDKDKNECTEFGWKLYALYDELLEVEEENA